jgi:hypothetical protein
MFCNFEPCFSRSLAVRNSALRPASLSFGLDENEI